MKLPERQKKKNIVFINSGKNIVQIKRNKLPDSIQVYPVKSVKQFTKYG